MALNMPNSEKWRRKKIECQLINFQPNKPAGNLLDYHQYTNSTLQHNYKKKKRNINCIRGQLWKKDSGLLDLGKSLS